MNHVELVRKARGAEMPKSFWEDPLIYQGGSDDLLGARDDARFVSEEHGIDLEAEVAVITDDVPMGTPASAMAAHVKLLMLVNDWTLRNLVPGELAKGFGFYQSKPATGFSPVAVTPDELGDAWRDGKVHLPSSRTSTASCFGSPNAGVDMTFNFHRLLAHAARTRRARRRHDPRLRHDFQRGSFVRARRCLAERRTLEQIEHGAPARRSSRFGDVVRIEMKDAAGRSDLWRDRASGDTRVGLSCRRLFRPTFFRSGSMGEYTTLMARDGHEFRAWLSAPAGRAKGAVVVIQEIFGVNSHIRAVTDSFAAEGYIAIAPALFDRIRMGIELGYTDKDMQEGRGYVAQIKPEQTLKDISAALTVVKHAGRVGAVGYCWGGRMAYLAASELPLACSVVVLRRRHHAGSGQETEVPGDVPLRRAGQTHHDGRRREDPRSAS